MSSASQTPAAVLFDLDGTLIDTAPDFVVALNSVVTDEGQQPLDDDLIRSHVSAGARALIRLAFDLKEGDAAVEPLREKLLAAYEACLADHSVLFPGLDTLLARLDNDNIPWGIVTNKPHYLAKPLVAKLALETRCKTLICPDHVKNSKPDPEALVLASQQISVPAEACIYVGDHERDIVAGNRAQMQTIAALYGYIPPGDDPYQWEADHYAKTSEAVEPLIFTR